LDNAADHPDAMEVFERARRLAPDLSLATVYRTVKQLAELGLLTRHSFGKDRWRYEKIRGGHHEHLVDVHSDQVVEFLVPELAALIRAAADRLGYDMLDYRLEIFAERHDRSALASREREHSSGW
jgi:Fur family ferric uptake transcriptional regulator